MIKTKKEDSIEAAYFARNNSCRCLSSKENLEIKKWFEQKDKEYTINVKYDGDDNNNGYEIATSMATIPAAIEKYKYAKKLNIMLYAEYPSSAESSIFEIGNLELNNQNIYIKRGYQRSYPVIKGNFKINNSQLHIYNDQGAMTFIPAEEELPCFTIENSTLILEDRLFFDWSSIDKPLIEAKSSKIKIENCNLKTHEYTSESGGPYYKPSVEATHLSSVFIDLCQTNGKAMVDNSCTIIKENTTPLT